MTRKMYEQMATEFGLAIQERDSEAEYGLWAGVKAFCTVAKRDNPKFNEGRFLLGVTEVRDGERNVNGEKIKTKTNRK